MSFQFLLRRKVRAASFVLAALAGSWLSVRPATAAGAMRLIDFGQLGSESQVTINGPSDVATQTVDDPRGKALEVRCTPGANPDPGVVLRPGAGLKWNLSAYGEVEADVVNLSDTALVINLRVDNPAAGRETKGNSDRLTLPIGKTGTVRVYFGYSQGSKGYALDPAKVSQLVLFTSRPTRGNATFRVLAVRAGGKPGDKPAGAADTAAKPGPDGAVLPFDGTLPETQVESHGTRTALPANGKPGPVTITVLAGANKEPSTVFKTPAGTLLDLSDFGQVDFDLKNAGAKAVHVFCRVDNPPGAASKPVAVSADATLEPGASQTVTVPFAGGGTFASEKVAAFVVAVEQDGQEKTLEIASVKVGAPKPAASPTASPSASPSASPGASASPSPSVSPSPSPSPSASPGKSVGPSPSPTATASARATPTATAAASSPTISPSPSPSPNPSASSTPKGKKGTP